MLPEIGQWTLADVEDIAQAAFAETSFVEKKASAILDHSPGQGKRTPAEKIAKQICAFANAAGGFIVIGVNDANKGDGGIDAGVALKVGDELVKDWIEKIGPKNVWPPVINCEAQFVEYPATGRGALILHVPQSENRPHWVVEEGREVAFLRVGSSSDRMFLQTFLDIRSRGIAPSASIDDLSFWTCISNGPTIVTLNPSIRLDRGPVCEQWQVDLEVSDPKLLTFEVSAGSNVKQMNEGMIVAESSQLLFPERHTRIARTVFKLSAKENLMGSHSARLIITLYAGAAKPVRREFTFAQLSAHK